MIHTAHVLNGLTHEEAWQRGWQDHADAIDLATENEAALAASRSGRRLAELLDRIWGIAPYELPDSEPVVEEIVVFDWEKAA